MNGSLYLIQALEAKIHIIVTPDMVHVLIWMHISSIIQAPIWILLLLEINAIIMHIMNNAYLFGTQPIEQLRWYGS